jgi:hypothetical protein
MASVIATLKTHHDIRVMGKEVDNLAFALIPPLGSNNSDVGHENSASRQLAAGGRQKKIGSSRLNRSNRQRLEPFERLFPLEFY